jgi:hypothetical protein
MNQKLKYDPHMERAERLRKIKRVSIDLTLAAIAVGMWGTLAYYAVTQWLGSAP